MSSILPPFLDVSPFGPYCRECSEPLAIERGIHVHGKSCHPNISFKNAHVVREVKQEISRLRQKHCNDLTPFLKLDSPSEEMWFCSTCYVSFSKTSNFKRHLECTARSCPDPKGGKITCFQTTCGRYGPKTCLQTITLSNPTIVSASTTISSLSESRSQASIPTSFNATSMEKRVPPALMTTHETAMNILKPFVRPDEDVKDLSLIYYPLLSVGFEGMMREYIQFCSKNKEEEPILVKWIAAGHLWLNDYALGHISNVSANVRHRLAEFEQQEVDGVTYHTRTFTLRRNIPRLITELDAALRFFYRFPTTLFDEFKDNSLLNVDLNWMIERAIIPRILYQAAREEPKNHGQLPVACHFSLSRGFTIKKGQLIMNECGWFSSRLSAIMHLLRAGVCGYLVTLTTDSESQVLTLEELEVVKIVQNGRVTNLLGPYVKRLRDLNDRKPALKDNTVNANGDITSGAFTFSHSVWSTIIPRVVRIAQEIFGLVFDGDDWKCFLTAPVRVSNWRSMEASVETDSSTIQLCNLKLNDKLENNLGRLQAVAELCLFGLGTGAVRHEEVIRLKVSSCQWHNSFLYYWTETLKKGSLKGGSRPRMVEHRLSLSLSRIFMLLRYAFVTSNVVEGDDLLPKLPSTSMVSLVRDIFDFDHSPLILNVRHLFTSIGNILRPEGPNDYYNGSFVSNVSLTEKSGHTQGTGRRAYATYLENSDEHLYDLYHKCLGEVSLEPPLIEFIPFSDTLLTSAMKALLGQQATFRSSQQRIMVEIAANCIVKHSYIGMPCGQGKSLAWLVPIMAAYLAGRQVGMRIVILPYKFLLGHMVEHARSLFGLLQDRIVVEFIDSSDFQGQDIPTVLQGKHLPSLLFLNLDGASHLLRHHIDRLHKWAARKVLQRIYIDEFQQLIVEFGFRTAYQSLRELGRIGVPVMCLSGSMPVSIAMTLMSYCRLYFGKDTQSIETVQGSDPIGDGFTFNVEIVENIDQAVINFVRNSKKVCHIICQTKELVEKITNGLSNHCRVLTVTGDSASHEQMQCARDWSTGTFDVLVSTVVALVGNENKKCKCIVVAGFLYNVSSVVQAIGRLRPDQRGPDASVSVFRKPFHKKDKQEAKEQEGLTFSELSTSSCLNDDCKDAFSDIFSPVGLQKVLGLKDGCYLETMSNFYGYKRPICSSCSLCIKRNSQDIMGQVSGIHPDVSSALDTSVVPPWNKKRMFPRVDESTHVTKRFAADLVREAKMKSSDSSVDDRRVRRMAESVLGELMYRCIVCGVTSCNGEICIRGCYKCGDRRHFANSCAFASEKLAKIIPNKGVCFGCFDTLQRGIEPHSIKECPHRKRLRRLLQMDREKKNIPFDVYLRTIYADEMSFLRIVASYVTQVKLGSAWVGARQVMETIKCQQEKHTSSRSPLLPPDRIYGSTDISVDGTKRSTVYKSAHQARQEYQNLRQEKLSVHRQRKFVFGSVHQNLFPGYREIDPLHRDYDLLIETDSKISIMHIRLVSPTEGMGKESLLTAAVALGHSLERNGNARGAKVGDLGMMHAVGYRSASSKAIYKISDATATKVGLASKLMRNWMEDNLKDVLKEFIEKDKEMDVENSLSFMPNGPGSRMIISVNLANAGHYDTMDSSTSVALWVEERPGQARNWYFVLPNASIGGSNGVVIKLHHGVVISWDARSIFHCTSQTNAGDENRVYGCMWGCSRL